MSGVLEGLLFICGDDGLSLERIKEILEIGDEELDQLINELSKSYDNVGRGLRIEMFGSKLKLVTKLEYKDYFQKLIDTDSNELSQSVLETLAIIAYNQPIIRSHVDEIRGVDSSYAIKRLLIKELIEEKGRSDLPGRPMLFGTTDRFLDHFGLHSLNELPKINELVQEEKEVNLFDTNKK